MFHHRKPFLMAALMAVAAASAQAQMPASGEASAQADGAARQKTASHDGKAGRCHARMAERHAKRMAELKERLKISPAQEDAWNQFASAMQPPAPPAQRPDRAEFERLTTPERLDRMQAMQAEHQTRMAARNQAIKNFYAQLTPEQQKAFDQHAMHGRLEGRPHGWPHGKSRDERDGCQGGKGGPKAGFRGGDGPCAMPPDGPNGRPPRG